jgi:hypothetical protein
MIDQSTPNRSRSWLNRVAKKVSWSGMYTSPPSASNLWTRSASAGVARRARCVTLMHHHDDLAAEVLFVEAKRFLAVSAEVELRK